MLVVAISRSCSFALYEKSCLTLHLIQKTNFRNFRRLGTLLQYDLWFVPQRQTRKRPMEKDPFVNIDGVRNHHVEVSEEGKMRQIKPKYRSLCLVEQREAIAQHIVFSFLV